MPLAPQYQAGCSHSDWPKKNRRVGALPVPEVWDPDLTPNHPFLSPYEVWALGREALGSGMERLTAHHYTRHADFCLRVAWFMLATQFSSVHICRSWVSDSLRPHKLQPSRLPCPSPTPRTCSNSCPLRRWCHPTISSSVVPFSSCSQSFPASGSFPMSQVLVSGGQSIGVSASVSVLPRNIQDWFTLGLTGLTSLQSKGLSRVFSNITV